MNDYAESNYVEPYKSCYVFGVLRYFAVLKNAVCLVHGPTGCAYFHRTSLLSVNQQFHKPEHLPIIRTTNFTEKDTIFGGHDKLERAITEIDQRYSPELIVVLRCCATEIIGEDVEGVVQYLNDRIRARLVSVRGAGFHGDHRLGMKCGAEAIFDQFMHSSVPQKPKSINLIGELNPFHKTVKELCCHLESAGLCVNSVVPGGASVAELERAPAAALNYLVCGSAAGEMVRLFEKVHGIPFVGGEASFFGLENSRRTLKTILDFFEINSDLPDKLYDESLSKAKVNMEKLRGRTACVVAGQRRSLGYARLLKEIGFEVKLVFAEADDPERFKQELLQYSSSVMVEQNTELLERTVRQHDPDVVVTTLPELVLPFLRSNRDLEDFAGFEGFVRACDYFLDRCKYKDYMEKFEQQ